MAESKARWSLSWLAASVPPFAVPLSIPFVQKSPEVHPCPPETFHWGTPGTGSEAAGVILLIIAAIVWYLLCVLRARGHPQKRCASALLFCLCEALAFFRLAVLRLRYKLMVLRHVARRADASSPVPFDPHDELG